MNYLCNECGNVWEWFLDDPPYRCEECESEDIERYEDDE